jgi:selenocysteine lyase/cysteine desulfurase
MMTHRREVLKKLGMGTLTMLAMPQVGTAGSLPRPDDPEYWSKLRDEFMLSRESVFFNPATVGAMPRRVYEKMLEHHRYMAEHVADWAYKDDNKEEFISGYHNLWGVRTKVAALINARPDDIAMTDNVTNGMSYLANGLTLQPGDEVLTTNQEHVGGQSGFLLKEKRYGIVVKRVELPKPIPSADRALTLLLNAITPRTRVIMVSHMITGSGALLPVKELCREAARRGIFTILDGAQTIGQVAVDVRAMDCDAYVGCFHKWMGAPAGTGFLYVKPERMKDVWTTIASGRWDNHDDEGFRFTQRGTGNFSVIKGLEASLDFHFDIGPGRVYDRIKSLGQRLRNGLREIPKVTFYSPLAEDMCAGITVYNVEGLQGTQLQDEFWARGRMRPRAMRPDFGVRHCTHIFNSEAEIDRALEIVRALVKG